jgi:hypothetical protein
MASTASTVPDASEPADHNRQVLDQLHRYLREGLALKSWYEKAAAAGELTRFDLVETFNRPDRSQAFFGTADLGNRSLPVMGVIDEVFYDRPKAPPAGRQESILWMRDQIREFVLRYFLRISDFRRPQTVAEPAPGLLAELLSPISLRPRNEVERDGMGFSQVYYRRRGDSVTGEFPPEQQNEVVDLREIGKVYEWVALKLQVYQFNVTVRPLGSTAPQFMMPLKEESYLVVTPEFITDRDRPEPGVLGEYGFGYAFVRNPRRGPFAYGPGEFEVAFQTINFRVLDTGEVWVKMTFCSDQPQKVLNLTLDPVEWSFTLADLMSFGQASRVLAPFKSVLEQMPFRDFNMDPTVPTLEWMNTLTAGQAAQQLAISKEELYKGFLRRHSIQHYQTVLGSLRTWRQVPDWLDTANIPVWVVKGWSS